MHRGKRSGRKREQVGADGARLSEPRVAVILGCHRRGVANHSPAGRMFDIKREPALQVWLVEARKSHARIHGNKQSVEVFIAIIFIFIPGNGLTRGSRIADERDRERVPAGDG